MKPGADLANEALAHQLKGVSAADIVTAADCTERSAQNWKQGRTGPQWHQVAKMLADPVLGPLVLKAAGVIALDAAFKNPPRPDAGPPRGDTDHG